MIFTDNLNNQKDQTPTYWSFLKLRIGFSILFLFLSLLVQNHCIPKKPNKYNLFFSQINEVDPYTSYILEKLDLHIP